MRPKPWVIAEPLLTLACAVEKAGSVPLMRAKDYESAAGVKVDNSAVLDLLHSAIESGDCVAMFPEGISRYHPQVAPLKTGAARIAADVMLRQKTAGRGSPRGFKLEIVTCSITYLHRHHFRSDVLVSFNPPITIRSDSNDPLASALVSTDDAVRREGIKKLTDLAAEQIRTGTLDAPSWSLLRCANTARRLYAPLGTQMPLGEHVRLTQRFVDALAGKRAVIRWKDTDNIARALKTPMLFEGKENGSHKPSGAATLAPPTDYFSLPPSGATTPDALQRNMASVSPMERSPSLETLADGYTEDGINLAELLQDLKAYQDDLVRFGAPFPRSFDAVCALTPGMVASQVSRTTGSGTTACCTDTSSSNASASGSSAYWASWPSRSRACASGRPSSTSRGRRPKGRSAKDRSGIPTTRCACVLGDST